MKLLLASLESLTNCEIPSSNPLQKACSGLLIAACSFKLVPKMVPKAGYECTLEKNLPMRVKESLNRNLMWLSEQF
jgi:hypothetical protein